MMHVEGIKIPPIFLTAFRFDKKRKILVALLIFLGAFYSKIEAQSKSDSLPAPLNFNSLSAEDKLLLELYKDSFDMELANFIAAFKDKDFIKPDTTVSDMDKRSHVEVGLGFASRVLINGREQGLRGVVFLPYVAYNHKTGLRAVLTTGFYTDQAIARTTTVPVAILTAEYQHTFFKRWSLGASYSRTFITYGTEVSRSLLNNTFNLSTDVNIWRQLIIEATFYVDWSSLHKRAAFEERQFGLTWSLRKEFVFHKFIGAKVFTIAPMLTAYFATDNLAFVRQRAVAEQVHDLLSPYTTGVAHFFGFVDIEPSIAFDWRIRNLDIFALPALAIPFNTFNYNRNVRVRNPKEYRFYTQAGIKYLFSVKPSQKRRAKEITL